LLDGAPSLIGNNVPYTFNLGWPGQKVENQNFFFQNQNLSELFLAKSERKSERVIFGH
jgi:hypothetical protein